MKSRLPCRCRIALLSLLQTALVIVSGPVAGLFFLSLCLLIVLWRSLSDALERSQGGGAAPPPLK
ncbi:MAG TPA: hypothetical protein H9857_10580 [Candidatus Desulfovibrio intestinigallinarum]|nr:hypothetical protein [Candidatus Desulfovibrio intestinigallinarum]